MTRSPPDLRREIPPPRPHLAGLLLVFFATTTALPAQDAMSELIRELRAELARERAARERLEQRVDELEGTLGESLAEQELEDRLLALTRDDVMLDDRGPRTVFPSALNPQIGVFVNALVEGGETQEVLGDGEGDRFSLRETEIDIRLPVAPWVQGVLIAAYEDAGAGEFEALIEEGYADISLGGLFNTSTPATARVGRFRPRFGHDNVLHTHDLLQANRPVAVQALLGGEGIIGDGFDVTWPFSHRQSESGLGRTSTLNLALVNGEMLTGEEGILGGLAEDAELELDSDAPIAIARYTEFMELTDKSDLELGASYLRYGGSDAIVEADSGASIRPEMWGLDVTWRHRPTEDLVGSWFVQAETIQTDFDYEGGIGGDFPVGPQSRNGWWLTTQRQMSPNTFLGVRYGRTDALASDVEIEDITPYFSWYLDEFFRIRFQFQHLDYDMGAGGPDFDNVESAIIEFTWNFGAHQPHPYWTNR